MKRALILLLTLLFVTGCAHYLSEQSRRLADRPITFGMLRQNPGGYRGKFVLLGGTVATVTLTQEGTRLNVIQHNVDSRELPDESIPSGGRFMAITPEALDPAIYKPGALVSMVGEVAGTQVEFLEDAAYSYPVIKVKEICAIGR